MSEAQKAANALDSAARANLSPRGQARFHEWKAQLLADGTSAVDIDQILRGFIWDEAESESRD